MSPSLGGQWIREHQMPVYIGGAELNVATALSKWNVPSRYCTALPENYLTEEIIADIEKKGIDTSPVYYSGQRIGSYYLPQGVDMKNAGVIYDRTGSSFAELTPGCINWEEVLNDCTWFHFSAISPSLNNNVAAVCREALYFASQKGITISVDLNYRSRLWKYGKKPTQVIPELVNYCNVIMGNIWAANSLLGFSIDDNIHNQPSREKYLAHATETANEMLPPSAIKLKVDGILGKTSCATINKLNPQKFLDQFEVYCDDRYWTIIYNSLVEKFGKKAVDSTQAAFGRGWFRRSNKRFYPEEK